AWSQPGPVSTRTASRQATGDASRHVLRRGFMKRLPGTNGYEVSAALRRPLIIPQPLALASENRGCPAAPAPHRLTRPAPMFIVTGTGPVRAPSPGPCPCEERGRGGGVAPRLRPSIAKVCTVPRLLVIKGADEGKQFELTAGRFGVGR